MSYFVPRKNSLPFDPHEGLRGGSSSYVTPGEAQARPALARRKSSIYDDMPPDQLHSSFGRKPAYLTKPSPLESLGGSFIESRWAAPSCSTSPRRTLRKGASSFGTEPSLRQPEGTFEYHGAATHAQPPPPPENAVRDRSHYRQNTASAAARRRVRASEGTSEYHGAATHAQPPPPEYAVRDHGDYRQDTASRAAARRVRVPDIDYRAWTEDKDSFGYFGKYKQKYYGAGQFGPPPAAPLTAAEAAHAAAVRRRKILCAPLPTRRAVSAGAVRAGPAYPLPVAPPVEDLASPTKPLVRRPITQRDRRLAAAATLGHAGPESPVAIGHAFAVEWPPINIRRQHKDEEPSRWTVTDRGDIHVPVEGFSRPSSRPTSGTRDRYTAHDPRQTALGSPVRPSGPAAVRFDMGEGKRVQVRIDSRR